jgi:hypothetical protein
MIVAIPTRCLFSAFVTMLNRPVPPRASTSVPSGFQVKPAVLSSARAIEPIARLRNRSVHPGFVARRE